MEHADLQAIIRDTFQPIPVDDAAVNHHLFCMQCEFRLTIVDARAVCAHFHNCSRHVAAARVRQPEMNVFLTSVCYVPYKESIVDAGPDNAETISGFQCPYGDCDFATLAKSNVLKHMRRHDEVVQRLLQNAVPKSCVVTPISKKGGGFGYAIVRDRAVVADVDLNAELSVHVPLSTDPMPPQEPDEYFLEFLLLYSA